MRPKRLLIQHENDTQNTISSPVVQNMGSVDMGQPATLHNFITWGQQQYPAQHYLVDVWDHGSGVLPFSKYAAPTRGISADDTFNSIIDTIDLKTALAANPPLDVVAYDACLMQMAEIAYQTRNDCRYVVAGEGLTPGNGYPYQTWLGALVANPSMTPLQLSTEIARDYIASYQPSDEADQSVIDTTQLGGLASAVDTFSQALIAAEPTSAAQLKLARTSACQFDNDGVDLYDYASQASAACSGIPAVTNSANGVTSAISQAVVYAGRTDSTEAAHGIAIYLPDPQTYSGYAQEYTPLDFSQQTHWAAWLGAQTQ